MGISEHWTVDVQRFKQAVWAVERENFRPGDALSALERAKVDPPPTQGAVSLRTITRVECSGCGQEWHTMTCGGCGHQIEVHYVQANAR